MVAASRPTISPIRLFPIGTAAAPETGVAKDAFGRAMTYLRISLTDRCNFRCVYCMPALGMKFQPKDEHLTDDELLRLIGLFARVGVTKVRLTGGEPTIRRGIVELVRGIKSFPGIKEVSMTTNALLLGRLADDLAEAGLDRVNVSIDTLDPDRFKSMTRGGRLDLVWQGIEAADAAGLRPIKLNTVVVKDQNDFEVGEMAALTLDRPWQVRFLEIMPLEGVGDVHDEGLVSSEETQERLEARFGPLEPVETDAADPARLWKIPGAAGHDRVYLARVGAVLRRVQPGPPHRRWQATALSAAPRRRRPARRDARRRRRRDAGARHPLRYLAQAVGSRFGRRRTGNRARHVPDRGLTGRESEVGSRKYDRRVVTRRLSFCLIEDAALVEQDQAVVAAGVDAAGDGWLADAHLTGRCVVLVEDQVDVDGDGLGRAQGEGVARLERAKAAVDARLDEEGRGVGDVFR